MLSALLDSTRQEPYKQNHALIKITEPRGNYERPPFNINAQSLCDALEMWADKKIEYFVSQKDPTEEQLENCKAFSKYFLFVFDSNLLNTFHFKHPTFVGFVFLEK